MNSRWISRWTCAALLCASSACGPKLPEGASRDDAEIEHHDFKLSADGSTLAYLRGAYPKKTYLIRRRLPDGKEKAIRLAGRSLRGPLLLSSDGLRAWVAAMVLKENTYGSDGTALLEIDLNEATLKRELEVEPGTQLLAEEDGTAVVLQGDSARLGPPESGGVPLGKGFQQAMLRAERAVLASAAEVAVFDRAGGPGTRFAAETPAILGAGPDRSVLLARREERDWLLEELDPTSGRRRVLFRGLERPSSTAANKDAVFLVTDSSGASKTGFRPRTLRKIDWRLGRQEWASPWARRPTRLLGCDAKGGSLYLAVTDREGAAFWTVAAEPGKLPLYRDAIDASKPSPWRTIGYGSVGLVLLLLFLSVVVEFRSRGCKNCGER